MPSCKTYAEINRRMKVEDSQTFVIAFSRNERTHPNFVSQAPEIQIFCENCKLAPPLGFIRGFGLVVEYIVPGDEVDACAFFRGFGLVVELINNYLIHVTPFRWKKIKAKPLKKKVFFFSVEIVRGTYINLYLFESSMKWPFLDILTFGVTKISNSRFSLVM